VTKAIVISADTASRMVGSAKRERLYRQRAIAARFWEKVDKNGSIPAHVPDLGRCWMWQGSKDSSGYGGIRARGKRGRLYKAHRVSWSMHNGALADSKIVRHLCDNPGCVNPAHLAAGTQRDNILDAVRKGRMVSQAHPELLRRGERHPSAKLLAVEVAEIRELYTAGWRQAVLARRFGVTQAAISALLNGLTWRSS